MTVHLKKLSVGATSIDSMRAWQNRCVAAGEPIIHPTRNWPRRSAELLDGGSIYWIIKGKMQVRQAIADMIEIRRADGKPGCGIVLDPVLVPVWPRQMRIFQGWRYLEGKDAPDDMPVSIGDDTPMPAELVAELRELGLL